ncbi:hypothetical protein D3C81_1966640 [compost metagenome]
MNTHLAGNAMGQAAVTHHGKGGIAATLADLGQNGFQLHREVFAQLFGLCQGIPSRA